MKFNVGDHARHKKKDQSVKIVQATDHFYQFDILDPMDSTSRIRSIETTQKFERDYEKIVPNEQWADIMEQISE